jgi:hypothetical protein
MLLGERWLRPRTRQLGDLPLQGVNVERDAGDEFVLAYYGVADPGGVDLPTF